jgi:L-2-hydroxyglutarate oxidase LhgO
MGFKGDMTTERTYDLIVVGAGIVGLTVALEAIRRRQGLRIAVLEKEASFGVHASGRNSGILHAGIYYGSDSLKARVCSSGCKAMKRYALERGIKMEVTGKVIVAATPESAGQIDVLEKRARSNGVRVERLDADELKEVEPRAHSFGDALYSPDTAVIDSKAVLEELGKDLRSSGIDIFFNAGVEGVQADERLVETKNAAYRYGHLINCAGAHADRIAHLFGMGMEYSIVPFRGSYYRLSKKKNGWIKGNIYPAPDLRFPFLGVHLTRGVDGEVYIGPTATPAFGRENYHGLHGVIPGELPSILGRLARMYLRNEDNFRALVHSELAKHSKRVFLQEVQTMVPGLEEDDMEVCGKAGIRPQIVNTRTWQLEMDFIIEHGSDSTQVLNAISPAFTSAFEFARLVAERVEEYRPLS